MNLDDMTEKDAKDILDRWARVLGFKEILHDEMYHMIHFFVIRGPGKISIFRCDNGSSVIPDPLLIPAGKNPCLRFLREMFRLVKNGSDICMLGRGIVVQNGTAFEEFMIGLDLRE